LDPWLGFINRPLGLLKPLSWTSILLCKSLESYKEHNTLTCISLDHIWSKIESLQCICLVILHLVALVESVGLMELLLLLVIVVT
jgi:hypothetical protein